MIDTNGIYSFECADLSSYNTTIKKPLNEEFHRIQKIYTFPKKIYFDRNDTVGIDLGNSNCFAAVTRKNRVETVVLDNNGERHLPSYVSYDMKEELCGQLVINRFFNHAKSSVYNIQQFLGGNTKSDYTSENSSFNVINVSEKLKVDFQSGDHKISKYPEEVSAFLLKHIKKEAEKFQGKKLSDVVITVPQTFKEQQKEATHVAALLAGWKNIYLLPEHIATVFGYLNRNQIFVDSNILLFNLGGNSLNVSLIEIKDCYIHSVKNMPATSVNGKCFDELLFTYFSQKLEFDYDILALDIQKIYKLKKECQNIKHSLSVEEEAVLNVGDYNSTMDGFISISQAEFEVLAEELKNTIIMSMWQTLNGNIHPNQILYAGGGCRMPMIKKLLKELFPKAEHCCDKNPDEVIAIGAVYYSCYLNPRLIDYSSYFTYDNYRTVYMPF